MLSRGTAVEYFVRIAFNLKIQGGIEMKINILLAGIAALLVLVFGCSDDSSDSFGANKNSLSLVNTDIVWNLSQKYNECVQSKEDFYLERDMLDQEGAMAMYQAMASYPVELYPACESKIVDAVNSMVECTLSKGVCSNSVESKVEAINRECLKLPEAVRAGECILKEAKEGSDVEALKDSFCMHRHECMEAEDHGDYSYDVCVKDEMEEMDEMRFEEAEGTVANGCYNLYLQESAEFYRIKQKMYEAYQCEGIVFDIGDATKMSMMREERLYMLKTLNPISVFYKVACDVVH